MNVETKQVKLSALKLNPNNPRRIGNKEMERLVKSLQEFPDMLSIREIVVDETMTVLGGNMRLLALKKSGAKECTAKIVTGLTPEQKREFIIKDNSAFGEWDMDLLSSSWSDLPLVEWGVDLPEDWLKSDAEPADAEPQMDKAAELNKIWKVKAGDLFAIGSHRLLCGDSTKAEDVARVMGGEKADMVFTDPPYGIEVVQNKQIGGGGAFGGKKNERKGKAVISANAYAEVVGDETTETAQKFYALCVELGFSNMILWGGNYFTDFLPPSRGWVCWDKIDGVEGTTKNFSDIELAWTSYDVPARIVRHRWQGLLKASEHNEKRCHPTQKPAALAAECFELYKAGAIIFDGFLGSGTTMVACQNLNRKCRGIEISPDYCAVILQRMTDAFPNIEIKRLP